MKRFVGLVAIVLGVASCTTTNPEQEKEIAQLRSQLEQARADKARAEAELAEAQASAKRMEAASGTSLYQQALAVEAEGRGLEAVSAYVRAARSGSGKAALRLAQIYEKGIPGVSVDYANSLKWYIVARELGEDVPAKKRP